MYSQTEKQETRDTPSYKPPPTVPPAPFHKVEQFIGNQNNLVHRLPPMYFSKTFHFSVSQGYPSPCHTSLSLGGV